MSYNINFHNLNAIYKSHQTGYSWVRMQSLTVMSAEKRSEVTSMPVITKARGAKLRVVFLSAL